MYPSMHLGGGSEQGVYTPGTHPYEMAIEAGSTHPTGMRTGTTARRTLNSDWSVNSFIIVVWENIF